MKCPRCSSGLKTIKEEGVEVQACPQCEGEWISSDELLEVVEHHNEVFSANEIASMPAVSHEILTAEEDDHDELNCPQCRARMEHFNYGDTSGIILHKCVQCDGIWVDKDQLEKVEMVVDGWKQSLEQDVKTYGPILQKIEMQEQVEIDKNVSISKIGFVSAILRHFCE